MRLLRRIQQREREMRWRDRQQGLSRGRVSGGCLLRFLLQSEAGAFCRGLTGRLLKNDAAHGLTVSPPNRDKLTMRFKPLKSPHVILSLSKDEAGISALFGILLE
jgi:hypothetical protein